MFDEVCIILNDELPEKTILVPASIFREASVTGIGLAVCISPDEAVHCSWDIYDKLGALADVSLN